MAICLNSPGGSVPAAVSLATFFWDNQIGTVIDENAACLSACSIIFMMGTENYADYNILHRKLHINGTLGFHRPALLLPEDQNYASAEVEKAFEIAIDSTLSFLQLANQQVSENAGPMMKVGLLEKMFSRHGQDFFYIDTVDKAGRWDIHVFGYEAPSTISLKEAQTACTNGVNWTMGLRANAANAPTGDGVYYLARIGRFDSEQATPSYRVRSHAELHDAPMCAVNYRIENREYRESGDWVDICGIGEYYGCWPEDNSENWPRTHSFSPIVIFPPETLLKDIPSRVTQVEKNITSVNSAWATFALESCLISDDAWRTVVNVKNFTNLRANPDFDAPVVAEAPLYLSLKAASAKVYLVGSDDARARCNQACNVSDNTHDEAAEAVRTQCIENNNLWYHMTIPETEQSGYISGKYLR